MMKVKALYTKILSSLVLLIFLWSSISWSAPVSYLRPQAATERGLEDIRITDVRVSLDRLNDIATGCSKQLYVLRDRLKQKKTRGDLALFGLWAERRMFILQTMAKLKRWLIAGDLQAPVPPVDMAQYQEPISLPAVIQADEEVTDSLLPSENIIPAEEGIPVGAEHASRTIPVFMAGGRGTRLKELYTMSDEKRQALGIDVPREKFEDSSKPTVPLSMVKRKSPFAYCLESQRRIAQDEGETPIVIIDGEDTREQILKSLRANGLFGFRAVILKSQGTVPVCNITDADGNVVQWGPVEYEPGGAYIESPDGGGGTMMAMGDEGFLILERDERGAIRQRVVDQSPMQWLSEKYPQTEAVNFIQTDMAVDTDTIEGLTGARAQTDVDAVAMTYDYIRGIAVKQKVDKEGALLSLTVGEAFTLGTVFSRGVDEAAIVEYAERGNELQDTILQKLYGITQHQLEARLNELMAQEGGLDHIKAQPPQEREEIVRRLQAGIDAFVAEHKGNATDPHMVLPANAGAYSIKWSAFENMVTQRELKPHVQWKKEQTLSDGSKITSEASELFAPDIKVNRVLQVDEDAAIPAKDPEKFVTARKALAARHKEMLEERYGVTNIGEGAIIEFSPLFRGVIANSLRIGANAKLYLGGSMGGDGFKVAIGKDVEIVDGTTVIIEGNGPVFIEDGVRFSGGTIVLQAARDGELLVIPAGTHVTAATPRYNPDEAVRAVDRIFNMVAGPVVVSDLRNARGELVVPGLVTMADNVLEWEGYAKPAGQATFVSAEASEKIAQEICAANPYIGVREGVEYTVYDEGRPKKFSRTEYYNTVYEKVVRRKQLDMTDDEIRYCLDNMLDNQVGRIILLYIRAMSEKHENGYPALWFKLRVIATTYVPSGYMRGAWDKLRNGILIDTGTALPIGDAKRRPFGDETEINYSQLMYDIWARTTTGVFSVSGVRQIFDPLFGDLPLKRFPCRYAVGTEPTLAAKCHAAAQADLLADLLQDPVAFSERIPKLADQTAQEQVDLKRAFIDSVFKKQKGKPVGRKKRVLIMHDTRSTGPALAAVDARVLLSHGIEVEYGFIGSVCQGAVRTKLEAVEEEVKKREDIDACIYISASHNDEGYNGIKLLLGDGTVMDETVAYPYIFVLRGDHPRITGPSRVKGVLEDVGYIKDLVHRVNAVEPEALEAVYKNINNVKKAAEKADRRYRNRVITGADNDEDAQKRIAQLRQRIEPLKLAIICDPNGGSREEAAYLESLGIKVYQISPRPRFDMKHELCPSTVAVKETDEELVRIREEAGKEGYTVIGSFHYDTDGDRRNFRPIGVEGDEEEFYLRPDMAQICFAIDVISYVLSDENYDFVNNRPKRLLGVAVNGPTSILIEELANILGFVVIRTQTGEAYVVNGMDRLGDMTWAQVKEAAESGKEEIIVPDSLQKWFDDTHNGEKIEVIVSGEGSNGSDFTKELLVRDPLHTIRSLVNFLNPETGQNMLRAMLTRLGRADEFATEWSHAWDTPADMSTIMRRFIGLLPANRTTDLFSIGGEGEKINPPLILGLVKDNFDEVFEGEYKASVIQRLSRIFGIETDAIRCEYVNMEKTAARGKGSRAKKANIGRQIGDGGYKVKFTATINGEVVPLGWLWFRDSITETGLTRRGVSVVFSSRIKGFNQGARNARMEEAYKFLNNTLTAVMDRVVTMTAKQILAFEEGKQLDPKFDLYAGQLDNAKKELQAVWTEPAAGMEEAIGHGKRVMDEIAAAI